MTYELKWIGVSPYKKKRIWGYLVDLDDNEGIPCRRRYIRTFWGYEAGPVYFQRAEYNGNFTKKLRKRIEQHPEAPPEIIEKVKNQYSQEKLVTILSNGPKLN
jgi:hypothetical protein